MRRIVQQKVPVSVAQQIEEYIRENGLAPGTRLPSEREFMITLGVGRSSLREGLRILEVNGLVDVRSGKGMFVSSPADARRSRKVKFLIDKKNLLDALKVRRLLELLAVEEAVENATEDDLRQIEASLHRLEGLYETGRRDPHEDKRFHYLIYEASGNEVLVGAIKDIDRLSLFWESPFGDAGIFDSSASFHRPIFEAIRSRDKAAARSAVKRLMEQIAVEVEQRKR